MFTLGPALLCWFGAGCADSDSLPGETNVDVSVDTVFAIADTGSTFLARPTDIAVSTSGAILIGDAADQDIKAYDRIGRLLRTVGRPGEGPGEFSSLWSSGTVRDSIFGYNIGTSSLSYFDEQGAYEGTVALTPSVPRIIGVYGLDDSLLLARRSPIGAAGQDLLSVLTPRGTPVSSFFDGGAEVLEGTPERLQRINPVADGCRGIVFAGLWGGDSVSAFGTDGRLLGRGKLEPKTVPFASLSGLAKENGGRIVTPDGRRVHDGAWMLLRLIALPGGMALAQLARHDVKRGADPIGEGGVLLTFRLTKDGKIATVGETMVGFALLGKDRDCMPMGIGWDSTGQGATLFSLSVLGDRARKGER